MNLNIIKHNSPCYNTKSVMQNFIKDNLFLKPDVLDYSKVNHKFVR